MFNTLGFKHVQNDNSIYIYLKRDVKIIVLVFINDIILVSKDNFAIAFTVQDLYQNFQSHYVNELLKYFGMDDCNPIKLFLPSETDLFSFNNL